MLQDNKIGAKLAPIFLLNRNVEFNHFNVNVVESCISDE